MESVKIVKKMHDSEESTIHSVATTASAWTAIANNKKIMTAAMYEQNNSRVHEHHYSNCGKTLNGESPWSGVYWSDSIDARMPADFPE